MMPKNVLLVILDGCDPRVENPQAWDAVSNAKMPVLDGILKSYPSMLVATSGKAVGLPEGQMGSSEVGHTNIASGQKNGLGLQPVSESVEDGTFYQKEQLINAIAALRQSGGTMHLDILLSDGGVHSLNTHVYAAMRAFAENNIPVSLHIKTDGRDCPPKSAAKFLAALEGEITRITAQTGCAVRLDTIEGRAWGMDRDKKWEERNKPSFEAIALGQAAQKYETWQELLEASYAKGITDEFIAPTILNNEYTGIKREDGLMLMAIRPDRQKQQFAAFADANFTHFSRGKFMPPQIILTMIPYTADNYGVPFLFQPVIPENTIASVIAAEGGTQLRVSHSQKASHVGAFMNGDGSNDTLFEGEKRIVIKTEDSNYARDPQMGADKVTDAVIVGMTDGINSLTVNYANLDMVGHTGDFDAAMQAAEYVDAELGRLIIANNALENPYLILVVADHGNAGQMQQADEENTHLLIPHTQHTTGAVPFIIMHPDISGKINPLEHENWKFTPYSSNGGALGALEDIAPTLLKMSYREVPNSMTGTVRFTEHLPIRERCAAR